LIDTGGEISQLLVRCLAAGFFELIALGRDIFQIGFRLGEFGLRFDERGFCAVDLGLRAGEFAACFFQIFFQALNLAAGLSELGLHLRGPAPPLGRRRCDGTPR